MIGLLKSLFGGGESIAPREAIRRIEAGAALIDVRESHEYAAGHAAAARHLPLRRIQREGIASIDELGIPAHATEILLVCESGMRSRIARGLLSKDKRHHYINVAGGMGAWRSAGLPLARGH